MRITGILLLSIITGTLQASGPGKDSLAIRYASTITATDLSQHLHILASDEFEGRETGRKGQKMAAEYLSTHFKNFGIPSPESGYFQKFPLVIQYPEGITFSANGTTYNHVEDFYSYRGFHDTVIKGKEIVFIGYGVDTEKYSDLKGIDLNGKIALILTGAPRDEEGLSIITGKEKKEGIYRGAKIANAQNAGASAVFFVDENFKKSQKKLKHFLSGSRMRLDQQKSEERKLPFFFISEKTADKLLKESGKKIGDARKHITSTGKPASFSAPVDIILNITPRKEKITSENVLGYMEGTDKKDELLVVTAHYDHIGVKDKKVYNGADDDGTGTVAILEMAQAFAEAAKAGHRPRRSILFMPVAGEEKGLLGSRWYTDNPVYPLENTIADLNIDMIGRWDEKHEGDTNYIYLIGADRLSTDLHKVSEETNKTYTKLKFDYTFNDPDDPNRFYSRSDHYSFAKKNIPVIFYFSGVHKDYHKHTDTVEKINFPLLEKRTRLVFHTAWELANREERIVVDKAEEE